MSQRQKGWLERSIALTNRVARVPSALGGNSVLGAVEGRLRGQAADLAHRAAERRLTWGTAGCISARLGARHILISRANAAFGLVSGDELLAVERTAPPPSEVDAESLLIHRAIYAAQAEAQAILQIQPVYATVIAARGSVEPPQVREVLEYWKQVQWVESGETGEGLAQKLGEAAMRSRTILLRSRGALVWSDSLDDLVQLAETLEHAAQMAVLYAQAKGEKVP